MKTFAIYPVANINIEGTEFTPSDQVGVVTCDIRLATLLGLIQFGHATAEEIDAAELMTLAEANCDPADSIDDVDADEDVGIDVESVDPPIPADVDQDDEPTTDSFVSDGLDEKIAAALLAQGVSTPDDLRKLIADGYDLTELDDIGKVRAEKILEIYG